MKSGQKRENKGFGIIQALIAAGITSIVSLGIVTMIDNARRVQRRTTMLSALNDLRSRLETHMRDQVAFNNTVNGSSNASNAPWSQLRQSTSVSASTLASPAQFVLYDTAGNVINLLGLPSADLNSQRYNGYSEKGTACADFNPIIGYGTEGCPISYRLLVATECIRAGVAQTACMNPQFTLVARLVFNPSNSTSSTLNIWRGLIPVVSGSTLATSPEKYDVQVRRTGSAVNQYFNLSASVSPTDGPLTFCQTADVTNTGGGVCTSSTTFIKHPLTVSHSGGQGWIEEADAYNLVTVDTSIGDFRFNQTGLYRCVITAKAFSSNVTFSLFNRTTSATIGSAAAITGRFAEGEARIDTTVRVTTTSDNYRLMQECDGSDPTLRSCVLGFAKAGYSGADNRLISVNCDRLDVAY